MRILVTGGAGFIGSHIADAYVSNGHEVIALDNLSTGSATNVPAAAQLVHGDVTHYPTVSQAVSGVEIVFHEAAARAVARSVEDPLETDRVNTHGTLNVLLAARDAGVKRVVLASSSSIYGGLAPLPTPEDAKPSPQSPYAVSKWAAEAYARVFTDLYGIETVTLRYFNVYGPRQDPDNAYAAVIPLFIQALRSGSAPVIHGDGGQSRDFTFIDDVVRANELAASQDAALVSGKAYNIGRGESHSLIELLETLKSILGIDIAAVHTERRAGDVRSSCADISAARHDLGFQPNVEFRDGLVQTAEWFDEASSPTRTQRTQSLT